MIALIDAASLLQMRYVDVGDNNIAKYPYCIKVAPYKKYWYVSFFSRAGIVQRFNAADDMPAGSLNLGEGS